jgi:hypothetical protein
MAYKRMSMAVEVKAWCVLWVRLEKSHNKSNALLILKEICSQIELYFWCWKKILFITDAGSEYLNDRNLRWIEVTDLDTSKLVEFLKWKWHSLRITRKPQDNWFIENKNDYIERACLDDKRIQYMNTIQFIEHVDEFIQRNNLFLQWSKKSFRWKSITPVQNLQSRFWDLSALQYTVWLHCYPIELIYSLPRAFERIPLCKILQTIRPFLMTYRLNKNKKIDIHPLVHTLHTKSLDSSKY